MRGSRTNLIVAVSGAILVGIAAYFIFHRPPPRAGAQPPAEIGPSKLTPTPAKAADIRPVRAAPQTAPVNNEAARVRKAELSAAFRRSQLCYAATNELAAAKNVADCSFYEGKPQFERAYANCLNYSVEAKNRAVAAQKVLAGCGNERDTLKNYYEATKAAAKSGDVDAQLCYLQSYFFDSQNQGHFTEADIAEYKATAPRYEADAFERGDWRIVELLATRRFHANGGLLHLLDAKMGERETVYKMLKLLRLGATGEYAKLLDSSLNDLLHPDLNPAAALPQESAAAGDAWAQQTYTQYFAGSVSLTKAPDICKTDGQR